MLNTVAMDFLPTHAMRELDRLSDSEELLSSERELVDWFGLLLDSGQDSPSWESSK